MFGNADAISTHTGVLQRTYDIGEYCLHGTVKVAWKDSNLIISFYNYKTNDLQESHTRSFVNKFQVQMLLEDKMSSYYADKIMNDFYV